MSNRLISKLKKDAKVLIRGQQVFRGVDANDINNELTRIYNRDGGLRASVVLDEARPEDALLHNIFEWDDQKAAEEYRLNQSRGLIREVDVVYPDKEPVNRFVHVRAASKVENEYGESTIEGVYHPREVVAKNPDMFASAVHDLHARIAAARRSVDDLTMAAADFKGTQKRLEKMVAPVRAALKNAEQAAQALAD